MDVRPAELIKSLNEDQRFKLEDPGVSPALSLPEAPLAFGAWYMPKKFAEKQLIAFKSESPNDFARRQRLAYYDGVTVRGVKALSRTLNSDKYRPIRNWGGMSTVGSILERTAPSGETLDSLLKRVMIDAILAGVSYIYVDEAKVGPAVRNYFEQKMDSDGEISLAPLTYEQVWSIVSTDDGIIEQAQILSYDERMATVTRFVKGEWIQYERKIGGGARWEIALDENGNEKRGRQRIMPAPIIPVMLSGCINQPWTLKTPTAFTIRADIDVINKYSALAQAIESTNLPQLLMPVSAQTLSAANAQKSPAPFSQASQPKFHEISYGKEGEVDLSVQRMLLFNKEDGQPSYLTPSAEYADLSMRLIDKIKADAWNYFFGASIGLSATSSGEARKWDFTAENDALREVHSSVQKAEYQLGYLVALMKELATDYNSYASQVSVEHPKHFDPVGGGYVAEILAFGQSPLYQQLNDDTKTAVTKVALRTLLNETVSPKELSELIKNLTLEEEVELGTESTGTPTAEPTNFNPSAPGSADD